MIITGRKKFLKMSSRKKFDTLFLDRDGVLNRKIDNGYVLDFNQIEIMDGVPEFLAYAKNYFERFIVVTNQRCVGRGLLSIEKLTLINSRINELTGALIDCFYVCPHLDEDNCDCRKPKDGLFVKAQADLSIVFENSWMIGDSESDMIPAYKHNIYTVFISQKESQFANKKVSVISDLQGGF